MPIALIRHDSGRLLDQGNASAEEKRAAMRERIEQRFQGGIEAFRVEDYARARERWWDLAFQDRHPAAQTNLGVLYAHGLGVKRDEGAARRWYQRAIEQRYLPAQDNLKTLEESIKARQPRTMPQRSQAGRQIVDWLMVAAFFGLIMTSGIQPAGPSVDSYRQGLWDGYWKGHKQRVRETE
jgi:TPR repeat protein